MRNPSASISDLTDFLAKVLLFIFKKTLFLHTCHACYQQKKSWDWPVRGNVRVTCPAAYRLRVSSIVLALDVTVRRMACSVGAPSHASSLYLPAGADGTLSGSGGGRPGGAEPGPVARETETVIVRPAGR
jgi:hypothetical protein